MSDEIILYHFAKSTCSQKVRLALAEKGLAYTSREVNLLASEHLEDWYLQINPNGVVPTLVHNGQAILDSSVICEYLDETFPDPCLAPRDPLGRAGMRAWMRYFEEVPTAAIRVPSFNVLFAGRLRERGDEWFEQFTARMPLRKHLYREMGSDGFDREKYEQSMERLGACLTRVDSHLSNRDWITGEMFGIADIVLLPTVVRLEDLGLEGRWSDLPNLADWYERAKSRASFAIAYPSGARFSGF